MPSIAENKDPHEEPPPQQPPEAAPEHQPVVPTQPVRNKGKPRPLAFQNDENKVAMEKVFSSVIKFGAHLEPDNTTQARKKWIAFHDYLFNGDRHGHGPLADYEPYKGKEKQNKSKKLTLDNAKHFSKKWQERYDEEGIGASFTPLETLGRRIVTERDDAIKDRAEEKEREEAAKIEHRRKLEGEEEYVGAVPPG